MDRQATLDSVVGVVRGLVGTVARAPLAGDLEAIEKRFAGLPGVAHVKPMFGQRNGGELIFAFRLVDGGRGTVTLASHLNGMEPPPTTREQVIELAMGGMRPSGIAEQVGWKPESVSSLLSRARAAGEDIPRSPPGRPKDAGNSNLDLKN